MKCVLLHYTYVGSDRPMLCDLNTFVVPFVGSKWYNLGIQLLDSKSEATLRHWKTENHKNVDEICTKMFALWLTTSITATWNDVINALKSRLVRLFNLAWNVEEKLDNRVSIIYVVTYIILSIVPCNN